MKYLSLPINLVEFWYPEGVAFFIRTWKNLMLLLEEDLAVSLMWRLMFVPLFHDSSIVGRILSLTFRVGRILIGIFAFILATLTLFLIAVYFFGLPALAVLDYPHIVSRGLFLTSLGLFIIARLTHPHQKVWSTSDLWSASTVKRENVNLADLLRQEEVVDLLANLQLQLKSLPKVDLNTQKLGFRAFELAKAAGSEYITPRHFFVASLAEIPNIDNLLLKYELKLTDFEDALSFLETKKQTWRRVYIWDEQFSVRHLKGVNRGWLGVPTPALDSYSEDLTKKAATVGFPPFLRQNGVVVELINILSQQSSRNVILVGLPGSGKTALIKHLAGQIVAGDAPPALATKRLVLLDLTRLLSGIKTQGELAQRIKTIFEEVGFAQNVIIVIEEIEQFGLGEAGSSLNLYSLMLPFLESDAFQFIATTEPENYTRVLERNSSLIRIFRKIELPPATYQDTLNILEYRAIETERKTKVKTTFLALKTASELARRFIHDRVLPDSAISVLKEAQTQPINGWVTKEIITRVVSSRVKVPLMEIGTADKNKLLNLEQQLHLRLIDQEQAVKAVSDTLRRSATGLREEGRPIGSFLFVGPTGVGKTELAKTLSEIYFKDKGAFIRFDMSEYQNPESVVRLIGGPAEGGLLTESVRNRPYALLLLDEFEKANEKILTLFLQVLDDGRLTDGAGRTIDFSNSIIIATSNAGSLLIAQGLQEGRSLDLIDKQVNDELLKVLRPELVNRFDDVVLFRPLSQQDLQKIVLLKLTQLQNQMKEKGFLVEFAPELVTELGKKGFDPVLGARPLRRLIQDTLEANLSRLILENKLVKGQLFKADLTLLS